MQHREALLDAAGSCHVHADLHGSRPTRHQRAEKAVELIPALCFRTGGTLRLFQIGPGLVTATPENLRTKTYEAAVHEMKFIRPGAVEVTIRLDEQTHIITVVVIE